MDVGHMWEAILLTGVRRDTFVIMFISQKLNLTC